MYCACVHVGGGWGGGGVTRMHELLGCLSVIICMIFSTILLLFYSTLFIPRRYEMTICQRKMFILCIYI